MSSVVLGVHYGRLLPIVRSYWTSNTIGLAFEVDRIATAGWAGCHNTTHSLPYKVDRTAAAPWSYRYTTTTRMNQQDGRDHIRVRPYATPITTVLSLYHGRTVPTIRPTWCTRLTVLYHHYGQPDRCSERAGPKPQGTWRCRLLEIYSGSNNLSRAISYP